MSQNELRRDPITGNWAIIIKNPRDLKELLKSDSESSQAEKYYLDPSNDKEPEVEIMRIPRDEKDLSKLRSRVVAERHPVLQIHGDVNNRGQGLYDLCDGIGAHEIVFESPASPASFEDLPEQQISENLWAYQQRILDLKKDIRFRYILVHKYQPNHTETSDYKPFSNIIATPITPLDIRLKFENGMKYFQYKERCMFCDILWQEIEVGKRIIYENEDFVAISPFASLYPFQMVILPKEHETFFELNDKHASLAHLLKDVLQRLKRVIGQNSYEIQLQSGPNISAARKRGYWKTIEKDYHWHIDIIPKIKLVKTVENRVGFPVNIVPPDKATRYLRTA